MHVIAKKNSAEHQLQTTTTINNVGHHYGNHATAAAAVASTAARCAVVDDDDDHDDDAADDESEISSFPQAEGSKASLFCLQQMRNDSLRVHTYVHTSFSVYYYYYYYVFNDSMTRDRIKNLMVTMLQYIVQVDRQHQARAPVDYQNGSKLRRTERKM
jgi:hypothetical protein